MNSKSRPLTTLYIASASKSKWVYLLHIIIMSLYNNAEQN